MDDAADLGLNGWRVVVTVSVMVVVMRVDGLSVVEPETWHGVANDASHFAELLQSVLNAVLEVVRHDEQELLAGGDHEWYRGGEDENGDDYGCEWVPEVPRLP